MVWYSMVRRGLGLGFKAKEGKSKDSKPTCRRKEMGSDWDKEWVRSIVGSPASLLILGMGVVTPKKEHH